VRPDRRPQRGAGRRPREHGGTGNGVPRPSSGPRASAAGSTAVLVDASNVAHSSEGAGARLANIVVVRDKLREEGLDPLLVADAALRHQIDDAPGYEQLVERGELRQAPAGTDADYFILTFARELGAQVLSNDRFKDWIDQYPDVRDRIIRYMILAGEVVLERRTKRRGKGTGR
jgi:hypothetical protein